MTGEEFDIIWRKLTLGEQGKYEKKIKINLRIKELKKILKLIIWWNKGQIIKLKSIEELVKGFEELAGEKAKIWQK